MTRTGRALEVLRSGPLTLVEDMGRPGYAELGVPASGAADQPALRLGNRLVGNTEDTAGLELTLGSCELRARGSLTVAVTGAMAALTVAGRPVGPNASLRLGDGDVLTVGIPLVGVYCYLAVGGGIDVPPVLGSRSRDVLSGLGPEPVQAGDVLPVGIPSGQLPSSSMAPVAAPSDIPLVLPLRLGPRANWVDPESLATLATAVFPVAADSNRIGVRLDGPRLRRQRSAELPSEGMVIGAMQVPPSGQPVIFLADHPVTGGYPVVGVADATELPALAQSRPGRHVRFRMLPPPDLG